MIRYPFDLRMTGDGVVALGCGSDGPVPGTQCEASWRVSHVTAQTLAENLRQAWAHGALHRPAPWIVSAGCDLVLFECTHWERDDGSGDESGERWCHECKQPRAYILRRVKEDTLGESPEPVRGAHSARG